ncbi:MAG: Fic family protein [Desulfovibrio sp.]|nr:Fic family protein [Desulfovibrio sp.]
MNSILRRIDQLTSKISVYRPFSDENILRQVKNFFNIECAWSSNALEGNSYTLTETKILLEDGLTAGGRPLRDALAIIGHEKAYHYMFSLISNEYISEQDLLFMHSLLQGGLEDNLRVGIYRNIDVFITGSKYKVANTSDIEKLIKNLIKQQEELFVNFHPIVAAAKFHKELVFIHPFVDGNGRIARLAMNCLLIQRHLLPISIPPIRRSEYVATLEQSHINDYNFIKFIAECELETQKDFYRLIKGFKIPNDKLDDQSS